MARDDERLARLYGERPSPRARYGWAPALWLGGLLGLGVVGAVVSVVSAVGLATGAGDTDLVRAGVLGRDERVLALASARDEEGCAVLSSGFLVRWAATAPAGRVDLRGGALSADGDAVVATRGDDALRCEVGEPNVEVFLRAAAPFLARQAPLEHPARDPRVDAWRLRR